MPLYRVLQQLNAGAAGGIIRIGAFSPLGWLTEAEIAILTEREIVAPIASPKLSVLPGWKRRAEKLAVLGCNTVEEFLSAAQDDLAKGLGIRPETIARWKIEATDLLNPGGGKKPGG